MGKTSNPVRVDSDLYAAASSAAPVMSRSTAQQISHWARIGRELESSSVSVERVAEVLRGREPYDELDDEEQAVVRTHWRERMETLRSTLRLDLELAAEGKPYVELDEEGEVARRDPAAPDAASR